jgi:hypothetical protein
MLSSMSFLNNDDVVDRIDMNRVAGRRTNKEQFLTDSEVRVMSHSSVVRAGC